MQITLIRHAHYCAESGHLTREGIKESINAGLALGNAAHPKITDLLDNKQVSNAGLLVAQYPLRSPDVILTSPALRAKETGFAISSQLTQMGIRPEVRYNVACLNDLDLFTDGYRPSHHGYLTQKVARRLNRTKPVQETVRLIQRLAKEGKKHVVIISHQPNIHILLKLLGKESLYTLSGRESCLPRCGTAYTVLSVNPEKIGKEKYQIQIRHACFDTAEAKKLSALTPDHIEWYMPDFVFGRRPLMNIRKDKGAKVRE